MSRHHWRINPLHAVAWGAVLACCPPRHQRNRLVKAMHDPEQAVKLRARVKSRPDKSGAELHHQVS